jgi:serine protease Do
MLLGGAVADRLFGFRPLDRFFPRGEFPNISGQPLVLKEESVTIDIAKRVSPSVVTISVERKSQSVLGFDPFSGFQVQEQPAKEQDIATGSVVDASGLIATNKHVVSGNGLSYKAVTQDGKEYPIKKIYRDPANDLALLKIDPSAGSGQVLTVVELGDSDSLEVGQYVAAIGTALGEFRHSVTTGVISGLGRGIEAGDSPYAGYVERLDNVIQTDAAINPGNSGGPLLNSSGQVIGVNVAVAVGAQNIGFALPINTLKASIDQFHQTGDFARPFLGVQYQVISARAALLNEVPEGALVTDIVSGASADRAGIKIDDIIVKFAGEKISEKNGGLAALVNKHKVGETVAVEIWRNEKTETLNVVLSTEGE